MSGFDEALEQAITALHQGMSVDDCLARAPEYTEQLRPLLVLAAALYAAPATTMSPQAFDAQRERLRAHVRERTASASSLPRRAPWIRALAPHRTALLAAALLLAILLGLSGATLASAKVVPNEPLYPVKRAVEALVLSLPASGQTRAARALAIADSRLTESNAVCAVDPARAAALRAEMRGQRDAALSWLSSLAGPEADALRERATLLSQREGDVVAACTRRIEQLVPPAMPSATTAPTQTTTPTATLTATALPSATSAPTRTLVASPTPIEATPTTPSSPPTATGAPPTSRSDAGAPDQPASVPTRDTAPRPTNPPAATAAAPAPPPTATQPPPPQPTATQPPPPQPTATQPPPPPPSPTAQVIEVTRPPAHPTATPWPRPNSGTVTPRRP